MEIDKDINVLINDIKKLSFFDDEQEYMELHENSMIEIEDIEYESDLLEILEKTFKRYNRYLKSIYLMSSDKMYINNMIKQYIKKYENYKIEEYDLFYLMKKIDKEILDMIHSSKDAKFWLN